MKFLWKIRGCVDLAHAGVTAGWRPLRNVPWFCGSRMEDGGEVHDGRGGAIGSGIRNRLSLLLLWWKRNQDVLIVRLWLRRSWLRYLLSLLQWLATSRWVWVSWSAAVTHFKMIKLKILLIWKKKRNKLKINKMLLYLYHFSQITKINDKSICFFLRCDDYIISSRILIC